MTETALVASTVAYQPLNTPEAGGGDTEQPEKPHTWFNCCIMWRWYAESPLKRYPFLLFIGLGGLTVVWMIFYLTSKSAGYILSGIVVCLTAVYAFNHFRLLLALKEQVDEYEVQNKNFQRENAELSTEVDRLEKSKIELEETSETMKENVERQQKNLENFRSINDTIQQVGGGNVERLFEIKDRSNSMLQEWTKELKSKDKRVVGLVAERVMEETNHDENEDEEEYLEENDYNKFVNMLPNNYIEKIKKKKMSFEMKDDGDGKLTISEFTDWLDHLVDDKLPTINEEEQKENNSNDNETTEP